MSVVLNDFNTTPMTNMANGVSLPLTGLAVGGWNYGWPYTAENRMSLGADRPNFMMRQQGYSTPAENAISSASWPAPKRKIKASWQNSGVGGMMPLLQPSINNPTVSKSLRYTKEEYQKQISPVDILKHIQTREEVAFSRKGQTIRGADMVNGKLTPVTFPTGGVYQYGAPAGWIESKPNLLPFRGTSIPTR